MAVHARLGARELLDGLVRVVGVVDDHAAALDRLGRDDRDVDDAEPGQDAEAGQDAPGAGGELAALLAGVVARVGSGADMGRIVDALDGVAVSDAGGSGAVLRGLAEGLRNADELDAGRLAIGLEVAAELLEQHDPGAGPGGLVAVVAAAADGALAAVDEGGSLADAILAAVDDGFAELERGPLDDPHLAERGVVDATAAGVLLVLDALASVVTGEPLPEAPREPPRPPAAAVARFTVSCELHPNQGGVEAASWLTGALAELGELRRFDHGAVPWRCEVETALPGAVVETLLEVGRPRELRIDLLAGPEQDHAQGLR